MAATKYVMVYKAKYPQKLKGVGDVIRSTTYTLHEQWSFVYSVVIVIAVQTPNKVVNTKTKICKTKRKLERNKETSLLIDQYCALILHLSL